MGKSAYFIRTYGCPVKCPWCDSAGTWHPEYTPGNIEKAEIEELISFIRSSGCDFVVLTGGEPTIHDLTPLTTAIHEIQYQLTGNAYQLAQPKSTQMDGMAERQSTLTKDNRPTGSNCIVL